MVNSLQTFLFSDTIHIMDITKLDRLVAMYQDLLVFSDGISDLIEINGQTKILGRVIHHGKQIGYSPSTDWAIGGPIIEQHQIKIEPCDGVWTASIDNSGEYYGETALIAAMCCFVATNQQERLAKMSSMLYTSIP